MSNKAKKGIRPSSPPELKDAYPIQFWRCSYRGATATRLLFAQLSVMLVTSPSSFCMWVNRKRLGFHGSLRSLTPTWKINRRKRLLGGRNTWLNMQELPGGLCIGSRNQRQLSVFGERFTLVIWWWQPRGPSSLRRSARIAFAMNSLPVAKWPTCSNAGERPEALGSCFTSPSCCWGRAFRLSCKKKLLFLGLSAI